MTLIRERVPAREWRPFAIMAASVACVASTALVVDGYKATHKPIRSVLDAPHTVSALGTATRHVVPDQVRWNLTVSVHGADQRAARRNAMTVAEKARAFLVDHGIHADEITQLPVETEQATRSVVHHTGDDSEEQDDVPDGFDGTQTLTVRSTDIGRVLAAFRAATSSPELDSADVKEPACSYSRLEFLEAQLLPEARRAVRERIEATVKAVGNTHVGRLVSVDTGSFGAPGFNDPSVTSCEDGADATLTIAATFVLD